jgi:hypothetical protein
MDYQFNWELFISCCYFRASFWFVGFSRVDRHEKIDLPLNFISSDNVHYGAELCFRECMKLGVIEHFYQMKME